MDFLKLSMSFFKVHMYCTVLVKIEGIKKIDFLRFLILDTHTCMREDHNPKQVRSEMPAFSRNHIISVDLGDLSGTR